MSAAMSKELKGKIRNVLEDLVNGKPGAVLLITMGSDPITRDAANYLDDIGVLQRLEHSWRLTAYGREYWDRINTPTPLYWFKQNWFPAIVAAATILASIGGAVANFVS